MVRRQHLISTVVSALLVFVGVSFLFDTTSPATLYDIARRGRSSTSLQPPVLAKGGAKKAAFNIDLDKLPVAILDGNPIAPKLENATLKAELGSATWKFLHTLVARYPDKPTTEDRVALQAFIQLFARLYPCGDCAQHFQQLLQKYPPQTSSRNAAAGWLCFAHNVVNERLGKELFDCDQIGDFYDCGCGDDKEDQEEHSGDK